MIDIMPIHIKEMFLEIVQYYKRNFDFKYIQYITNLNRISKIHYEWLNDFNISEIIEIKKSLVWLNCQKLLKKININGHFSNEIIAYWACCDISQKSVEYAILLYNRANITKIIGDYPNYNLVWRYNYPDKFDTQYRTFGIETNKFIFEYKHFPLVTHLIKTKYGYEILKRDWRKINKKELQLFHEKPYLFNICYDFL